MVKDVQIRAHFEKIVWVSVGQEPDLRELQESIHMQLATAVIPDAASAPALVMSALRDAAKGFRVLLVLDDIWDPCHEKPLNCIYADNGSRLLVTTRIRGLLKNSSEVSVGVLSENEAFELLLSSASMGEECIQEGGSEHRVSMDAWMLYLLFSSSFSSFSPSFPFILCSPTVVRLTRIIPTHFWHIYIPSKTIVLV